MLGRYGRDLMAEAHAGRLHPVIGAEALLRRLKRILIQQKSNNPLLIGEPGVGKTAVVEGLAYELATGESGLPELVGKRIIELSINNLMAGTKYRGELEERMEKLIAEVKANPEVIVFIDEIHMLLGGGGDSITNLANALKPALARGEFPCIGATTINEYRQHIEKDAALKRRFETIQVPKPSIEDCITILQGLKENFEKYYSVRVAEGAIEAAVRLAARYLPDERLPAKAIKLLEQAGPYVKLPSFAPGQFKEGQAEQPFFTEVNEDLIRYVLAKQTGIPLQSLTSNELERLKNMAETLRAEVIGQNEAVEAVTQVAKRARTGLSDPNRPVGVFLFVGPTGMGKTELAHALAGFLFHNREAIIQLDMSEYMERHQVSRLIGAAPGYVGYEDEGQLTGPLRLNPHCVILLDEIEKAHEDVHNLFLQLFDKGRLTDSKGRTANGREAIFIMTSNVGSEAYIEADIGLRQHDQLSPEGIKERQHIVHAELKKAFKPEFLNRVDRIIHFVPLTSDDVEHIFELQFESIQERWQDSNQILLKITPKAAKFVSKAGYDVHSGARSLKRVIEQLINDPLVEKRINGDFSIGDAITIGYADSQLTFSRQANQKGLHDEVDPDH